MKPIKLGELLGVQMKKPRHKRVSDGIYFACVTETRRVLKVEIGEDEWWPIGSETPTIGDVADGEPRLSWDILLPFEVEV